MVDATRIVAPVSACSSGMISSPRFASSSATLCRMAARSSALVRDQLLNAALAAAAASLACWTLASGAWPTTCSVAGLTMS